MAYFRGPAVSSREGVPFFFRVWEVESMFLLPAKKQLQTQGEAGFPRFEEKY